MKTTETQAVFQMHALVSLMREFALSVTKARIHGFPMSATFAESTFAGYAKELKRLSKFVDVEDISPQATRYLLKPNLDDHA